MMKNSVDRGASDVDQAEQQEAPSSKGVAHRMMMTFTLLAALFMAERAHGQVDHPPFTNEEIKAWEAKLGSTQYKVRALASATLEDPGKFGKRFSIKNAAVLAPSATHSDPEIAARVNKILSTHSESLRKKYFPLPQDGNHWIDGIDYVPGKTLHVTIPTKVTGGPTNCNSEIISWYRQGARNAGVSKNNSPDYQMDHKAYELMANDQLNAVFTGALYKRTHQDVLDWNKKNPKGYVSQWLIEEFDKDRKAGLHSTYNFLGDFKTGSKGFRNKNNLAPEPDPDPKLLKYPELSYGPLNIRPPETISVVDGIEDFPRLQSV